MDKKRLLKHIIFLMIFMFLANSVALRLYWYYSIWWFDMLMHFLGGFWVGLFFTYIFYNNKGTLLKRAAIIILSVVLIGILWEVFEYSMGIIARDTFDIVDTSSDLFFDFAGVCVATVLYLKGFIFNRKIK